MNEYIVSARKYRPNSFETLIGQDNIARTLKNSIMRGQLAHAYLFCGPRGVGKTTTARIFAKMINCSNPKPNGDPCGECESCQSFAEGRSYCIYEMDAASNNSVDNIKELIDKVRIPPQIGRYSVYIIDEVHMLSQTAFNAFLKTLEEPPEYAIFILATTEKHKILPTILSRCQTYDFNRITVDSIVKNLRMVAANEGITIDDESLHVIALKADGAMRDALTLFDQTVAFCGTEVTADEVMRNLNVLDYRYTFSLVDDFLCGDYASALRTFDDVLAKGFNALHFVSSLSGHLRNLMVARIGSADSLLELADSVKEKYRQQTAKCSEKFIFDALTATTSCEQNYRTAINPRLHIEFLLMRLCFLCKPASTLVSDSAPAGEAPAVAPASAPVSTPAQAPTSAPAPAPVQEAPAPRRQHAAVEGLSLKSIAGHGEEEKNAAKASAEALGDEIPSDESIMMRWNQIKEEGKNHSRLFSAMESAKVTITEEGGKKIVRYAVVNESLKNWLSPLNARFEARMRSLLGSSRVDMIVDIQPHDPSERRAVSPEEKAREMMEKTPEMKEVVTSLGLEIK